MINESQLFSILLLLIGCSIVGLIGGCAGIYAFNDWRKKREFLEYLNKRLSRGKDDEK